MASRNHADYLAETDNRCLWHPFTPMKQWAQCEQIIIESGEGFELIDTRGRRYIDGFSSMWCNLHGHRVKRIDQAIRDQLERIAHSTLLGFGSDSSIELAERLIRISPAGLSKVFYSDSGATAVEIALKMAFQYYHNLHQANRRKFIALKLGYHGDTIGAVSVGGMKDFHELYAPLLFETTLVDTPNLYRNPDAGPGGAAVLQQIDDALSRAPGEYCAVILEPLIQGAGGMLAHPEGFLRSVRELTRKHDVLLIADEVATGFCRTGKLFACEHEGVTPDLMCLGKGLTGGYLPVAATLASEDVFDAFCGELSEGRTFCHGHTFTGNALGCAAGLASVDLIFENDLLGRLDDKVNLIAHSLGELADHPQVADIRQCGMMVGIELVKDRENSTPFDIELRTGVQVCLHARKYGLIIRPLGDVVTLVPAPGMDLDTLRRMMEAAVDTIRDFFENKAKS